MLVLVGLLPFQETGEIFSFNIHVLILYAINRTDELGKGFPVLTHGCKTKNNY